MAEMCMRCYTDLASIVPDGDHQPACAMRCLHGAPNLKVMAERSKNTTYNG